MKRKETDDRKTQQANKKREENEKRRTVHKEREDHTPTGKWKQIYQDRHSETEYLTRQKKQQQKQIKPDIQINQTKRVVKLNTWWEREKK